MYTPNAPLGTEDHAFHRMRRTALNPFCFKQAVQRLESMIQSKIELLCKRLHEWVLQERVLNVETAIMVLTMDVI